jgi:uncharacterized Tic20 family protein
MTDSTPAPAPAAPLSEADDKLWASLAHFGGILFILPSLIIFLVLKDRGARTRVESKEALNWQITVLIAVVALSILSAIFGFIPVIGWIVSLLLSLVTWAVWIVNIVFSILGGIKVQQGGSYRYPFALRLIK